MCIYIHIHTDICIFVLIQRLIHDEQYHYWSCTFFVYLLWQWELEENTDHNYSLSVCSIQSLCVAVSLIIVLFFLLFFPNVGIWFCFLFVVVVLLLFGYALREKMVNNCIIHWTGEDGPHYVYLKLVSWCNKRWRSVVYFKCVSGSFIWTSAWGVITTRRIQSYMVWSVDRCWRH